MLLGASHHHGCTSQQVSSNERLIRDTHRCTLDTKAGKRRQHFVRITLRTPIRGRSRIGTRSFVEALESWRFTKGAKFSMLCERVALNKTLAEGKAPSVLLADLGSVFYESLPWTQHGAKQRMDRERCSFWAGVGRLMTLLTAAGMAPFFALNFGNEWHAQLRDLAILERALLAFGISPERTALLDYNSSPRIGLRLHIAWWNHFHWLFVRSLHKSSEICLANTSQLVRSIEQRQSCARPPSFLSLGGTGYTWRGLVLLDMLRRDLLRHSRFSSASYQFCEHGPTPPEAGGKLYNPVYEEMQHDHETLQMQGPLSDRALVLGLCAMLPRRLDVDPGNKGLTVVSSASTLWEDSQFALTYDTHLTNQSQIFTTEKALKPMVNLRPFVLLGAPSALAELRSLGFHTFASVLNESYDVIDEPALRLRAALDEAARLVRRTSAAIGEPCHWSHPNLTRALVHNARHALCGGFKSILSNRAANGLQSMLHWAGLPTERLPSFDARQADAILGEMACAPGQVLDTCAAR